MGGHRLAALSAEGASPEKSLDRRQTGSKRYRCATNRCGIPRSALSWPGAPSCSAHRNPCRLAASSRRAAIDPSPQFQLRVSGRAGHKPQRGARPSPFNRQPSRSFVTATLGARPDSFNNSARVGSPAAFVRPAEVEPHNRVLSRRMLNTRLVRCAAFAEDSPAGQNWNGALLLCGTDAFSVIPPAKQRNSHLSKIKV